ncbi:hypothetical protein LM597_03875 [Candidatus Acetothermia bacterium]|nr:hypothetical protein [Candidatus Acetothermia bacterium]
MFPAGENARDAGIAGEFQALLLHADKEQGKELEPGREEVKEITGGGDLDEKED